jgi:hypothetical protein
MILQKPEVEKVFANIGTQTGAMGSGGSNSNISEIAVTLVPKEIVKFLQKFLVHNCVMKSIKSWRKSSNSFDRTYRKQ